MITVSFLNIICAFAYLFIVYELALDHQQFSLQWNAT